MTSMVYHIDKIKPKENEVVVFMCEKGGRTYLVTGCYSEGELFLGMVYHDVVVEVGFDSFKHWMPLPSLQDSPAWTKCVSCGGPALGDMCGFCLEEE